MVRVLVVEDSPVTREYLVYLLEQDPDIEVVGIARDGLEAVAQTERLRPGDADGPVPAAPRGPRGDAADHGEDPDPCGDRQRRCGDGRPGRQLRSPWRHFRQQPPARSS